MVHVYKWLRLSRLSLFTDSISWRIVWLFSNTSPPDVELLVTMYTFLDSGERLGLVGDLFINNVTVSNSYNLAVRMIINPNTTNLCKQFS